MFIYVQSICNDYDALLNDYREALNRYSEAAFMYKKDEHTWSLSQMYAHLFIASKALFLQKIKNCLTEEHGSHDGQKTELGAQVFEQGHFPIMKIKPPEKYRSPDPDNMPKSFFEPVFEEHKQEIRKLASAIDDRQTMYKTSHEVFGMLSADEWYLLDKMHWTHHLVQQLELEAFAADVE